MLQIKGWRNDEMEIEDSTLVWGIGDPVPILFKTAHILATDDELDMIVKAMQKATDGDIRSWIPK